MRHGERHRTKILLCRERIISKTKTVRKGNIILKALQTFIEHKETTYFEYIQGIWVQSVWKKEPSISLLASEADIF